MNDTDTLAKQLLKQQLDIDTDIPNTVVDVDSLINVINRKMNNLIAAAIINTPKSQLNDVDYVFNKSKQSRKIQLCISLMTTFEQIKSFTLQGRLTETYD